MLEITVRPALTEHSASTTPAPSPTGRGADGTHRSRQRIVLAWLLVVLWAAVIWQFGTDAYSLRRTSNFMQWVIEGLIGPVDPATRYKLYILFRKSAHFIEYAILALLSFRAALLSAARARVATACWIAIFFVATIAAADELRQSYSSARTGSPYDVLIDVAGGVVGLAGVVILSRRLRLARAVIGAT
ncbi:VanZ family protein [Myxococcota bacterium]|nr:VanZ family protein [Myxococcota bacterium]